jgi:hypothetical protein
MTVARTQEFMLHSSCQIARRFMRASEMPTIAQLVEARAPRRDPWRCGPPHA